MKINKEFTVCPACGHEGTVIQDRVDELISDGKMPVGTRLFAMMSKSPLLSPTQKIITSNGLTPGIVAIYDICSSCGCLYAVAIEEVDMIIPTPQQKKFPSN